MNLGFKNWLVISAKATDPLVESKSAKLVVVKTPNAVNPFVLDHIVSSTLYELVQNLSAKLFMGISS
jgi:hypothetical protein